MVEAAVVDAVRRDAGVGEQALHVVGQRGRTGSVVAQRVELVGKAAEVVHGLVARAGDQHRLARERVRR